MLEFERQLQSGLERCHLFSARVLLAVSGGPDSIAMLRGMLALADANDLDLRVGHLNHQLRGAESDADASWLESLCRNLGVPYVGDSRNVSDIARDRSLGIEETARSVRYEFLERAARTQQCTHVAVAHTADDQAETILHHILRGTGLEGLRGMRPCRELHAESRLLLVRPMLEIRRIDVEAYLVELGQRACGDASNLDERLTRNRIRLSLLPALERDFNPQVRDALRNLGRQAGELQDVIQSLARELLDRCIEDRSPAVARVNCGELSAAPRHLIRECFALLWKDLGWPRGKMGFAEWDRLAALTTGGGTATLPGNIQATRRGRLLVLQRS